ncbi:hypothetical protein HPP92_019979 [Vanilla planifolia]|uniref:Uncharacterized protein n=1 Tax=Vanilla planifolia TaxID=51239 RepID=A0A835Q0G6_VANPL|nr:hypothetical protein HPP92_019979 [Vanilla planifolia]
MASLTFFSSLSHALPISFRPKVLPLRQSCHLLPFVSFPKHHVKTIAKYSSQDQDEQKKAPSSIAVVSDEEGVRSEESVDGVANEGQKAQTAQQEIDWKTDEEFKKFMGNPRSKQLSSWRRRGQT